jgi:hypothetical protein
MSLYLADLIAETRDHTENSEFSDTIGIQDSEFIRFINDGQARLHSLIVQQHMNAFLKEVEVPVVNNQEAYAYPKDIYLNSRVTQIMYKHTADDENFFPLKPSHLINRRPGQEGRPNRYIRQANTFLINPVPTGAGAGAELKISYTKEIPRLDLRRARVGSVTLDTSARTITALSLNVSTETIDIDPIQKYNFFCIVDKNGVQKMTCIPYDSIDTTTGDVTIEAGFQFDNGETIEVGDYLVPGKNSTTHSEFPGSVERYLIAYAGWKILRRDSSVDFQDQQLELQEMEAEIVAAYADLLDDIYEVPLVNDDIDWFGWF